MNGSFRVVILSWEFPPRIVGGIAPHVYNLSRDLVRKGIDTYVVTCDFQARQNTKKLMAPKYIALTPIRSLPTIFCRGSFQ